MFKKTVDSFLPQRLDSLSRAPVFSHFSDTLTGLVTIRSFRSALSYQIIMMMMKDLLQRFYDLEPPFPPRVQPKFINALCEKIDTNTSAFLILQVFYIVQSNSGTKMINH